MHAAARGVGENARLVGNDAHRVLGTTGVSVAILGQVVTNPAQLQRLIELIVAHDFMTLIRAFQPGVHLPPDFFPNWIRRAGGYFPKFAQVLSVRADLIHNREVLEQFGRCIEDMPARPHEEVKQHLLQIGWDVESECIGESLNAGTVAQVNMLRMPDGTACVLKVAWPDTRRQMETDFRLFAHARRILAALKLDDENAQAVAAIFSAVGRNEASVLSEFDMEREASALHMARSLCEQEWAVAYQYWLDAAPLAAMPPHLALLATQFVQRIRCSGWVIKVPEPLRTSGSVLAMSHAGGKSIHKLFSEGDSACQQEVAQVVIAFAIPFIGWLLLCKSTSHLAHVDPHLGNFRWDNGSQTGLPPTLWVLDWGSNVTISTERRIALCLLISLVEGNADDESIADTARSLGVRSENSSELSRLWRGMMNASVDAAAQDALNHAAMDSILDDVSDDIVPIIRCLATLGGILKELQRRLREDHHQDVQMSLASLWAPFASMGLQS